MKQRALQRVRRRSLCPLLHQCNKISPCGSPQQLTLRSRSGRVAALRPGRQLQAALRCRAPPPSRRTPPRHRQSRCLPPRKSGRSSAMGSMGGGVRRRFERPAGRAARVRVRLRRSCGGLYEVPSARGWSLDPAAAGPTERGRCAQSRARCVAAPGTERRGGRAGGRGWLGPDRLSWRGKTAAPRYCAACHRPRAQNGARLRPVDDLQRCPQGGAACGPLPQGWRQEEAEDSLSSKLRGVPRRVAAALTGSKPPGL